MNATERRMAQNMEAVALSHGYALKAKFVAKDNTITLTTSPTLAYGASMTMTFPGGTTTPGQAVSAIVFVLDQLNPEG